MSTQFNESGGGQNGSGDGERGAPVNTANRTGTAKATDMNRCRTGEFTIEQIQKQMKRRESASLGAPKSDEERGASAPT